MFNFQKFEKTNARYEDRISITGTNSIGFPTKFYQDNNLVNYKYVVLYYDVEQKAIGMQFTNSEEELHKFSILKSNKGYGGSIVATSFFKTYDLDPKLYKGKYLWTKVNQENIGEIFVIQLQTQVESSSIPTTTPEG